MRDHVDKSFIQARAEERRKQKEATAQWMEGRISNEEALRQSLSRKIEQRGPALSNKDARRALAKLWEDNAYKKAYESLQKAPWIRTLETWEPVGKGRTSLFRSLCQHVLAKYPMPSFLWNTFFEASPDGQILFVAHIANGGSVYDGIKQGLINVPLTRKMCHDFMKMSADETCITALRKVVVKAFGGTPQFFQAWMGTNPGRTLMTAKDEAFWMTVIEFFSKNPMMDPSKIGPLVDFIAFRRRQDEAFSMKGRTVIALLKGMEEWHGNLSKEKGVAGHNYLPSGFQGITLEKKSFDNGYEEAFVWHVDEILSGKALAEEGRKLGHCVYSYSHSIQSKTVSIWSLNFEKDFSREKVLTIEVRNAVRQIVQVRGKHNRRATAKENALVLEWSQMNGLQFLTGWT